MEPRRSFLDTTDAVAELVSRVRPDVLAGPGLGAWDMRGLIGHTSRAMSTVITYLKMPATTVTCPDPRAYYVWIADSENQDDKIAQRGVEAGTALGDDIPGAFAGLARQVRGVLDKIPMNVDPVVSTLAGGMLLSHYLPTRTFELIVHGYDIARAADIEFAPHPEVVAETVALAARIGVALGHGPALVPVLTGRGSWNESSVFSRAVIPGDTA
ncbi:maleylpyruvate isomerase N-terminal domain-containing protein [Mobilicoccus massiliensis]|uniref:maleylpyruvate isomerase N-terminal domain-containing protein n=1 Tax=Mobilicoccus massiliensis TaxID=1522310 RepID=UPI00058C682E|nr:maleylpyruvate isomerase N-terminal domain-containing protein [Mobilicoccus massiliensis]